MRLAAFALVLVLNANPAISQTTIKGHHLGESVDEFLRAEPRVQTQLLACHADEPKLITPEQLRTYSRDQIDLLSVSLVTVVDPTIRGRKQLEAMAKLGTLFTKDQRTSAELVIASRL